MNIIYAWVSTTLCWLLDRTNLRVCPYMRSTDYANLLIIPLVAIYIIIGKSLLNKAMSFTQVDSLCLMVISAASTIFSQSFRPLIQLPIAFICTKQWNSQLAMCFFSLQLLYVLRIDNWTQVSYNNMHVKWQYLHAALLDNSPTDSISSI